MWKKLDITDLVGLEKFASIQRSMGGTYLEVTKDSLVHLLKRKKQCDLFLYEDTGYEITLGFIHKPLLDKIKISHGAIGKCANHQKGMEIIFMKIKEYLTIQKKKAYSIIDSTGLLPKADLWYSQIAKGADFSKVKYTDYGKRWEFEL